jgi:hypothetical protein
MKQQIAVTMAGFMLLASGCENNHQQWPFNPLMAKLQTKGSRPIVPEDVGEKNIHNQWQGKSSPNLYDGGFFARADFLYWRADEDGLEYGAEGNSDSRSSEMRAPKVQWNPGFRVGVGYTFNRQDYWDLTVLWTHFQTHHSAAFHNHGDSSKLFVPWWGSDLGAVASSASAHWTLIYNTYDLDLGRSYFVSKTFSVHPFMGLRGSTIDQRYHAHYNGLFDSGVIPTSFTAKNDFWGVGAHLGTGLEWYCMNSFSLIGQIGGSLLYANFHMKESSTIVSSSHTAISPFPHEQITTAATNVETMLGVQWETFFYQNKWRLVLGLKYEWNQWFSQNRLIRGSRVASVTNTQTPATLFNRESGNLTLQGASFQARLDF